MGGRRFVKDLKRGKANSSRRETATKNHSSTMPVFSFFFSILFLFYVFSFAITCRFVLLQPVIIPLGPIRALYNPSFLPPLHLNQSLSLPPRPPPRSTSAWRPSCPQSLWLLDPPSSPNSPAPSRSPLPPPLPPPHASDFSRT